MALCPHCNKKALDPILKSKPYMIIKESFTDNEMEQGNLFTLSGKNKNGYPENTTSYYLMKELGLVGLNLQIMSLSALWLHNPPTGKKPKDVIYGEDVKADALKIFDTGYEHIHGVGFQKLDKHFKLKRGEVS